MSTSIAGRVNGEPGYDLIVNADIYPDAGGGRLAIAVFVDTSGGKARDRENGIVGHFLCPQR